MSSFFASLDQKTVNIILDILVAVLVWLFFNALNKTLVAAVSSGTPKGKRLRTLSSIVRNTVSTVIVAILIVEILAQIGISLTPLIASAGVVGLAIGFGAQALVKDVISGFFLLAEDQFDEGDEVEVQGKRGVVEKITLRTMTIRDKDDAIHIIPNGAVAIVSNFSRKKKV